VVCSTCRKTEVVHHPAKAHERPSSGFVVLVDGVIHPGPIEHHEAKAIAYRHNCEFHSERPHHLERPHLVAELCFAPSQKVASAEAERDALRTQADELRGAGRTIREIATALNLTYHRAKYLLTP
jgi:hypothetical protein